jgi:hypothetical protein
MAVRVRLSDGIHLILNTDLEQFTKDYQEALKNNGLLEVENGSGRMRVINPQQILYFEDANEAVSEDDQAAEAARSESAEDVQVSR